MDVEDKACPCCGGGLHQIGEDVSERLDIVPATFRVLVTRRPRYGCRSCESAVVQVPAPAREYLSRDEAPSHRFQNAGAIVLSNNYSGVAGIDIFWCVRSKGCWRP